MNIIEMNFSAILIVKSPNLQKIKIVVLEQDTFILAKYWFNPGRPIPV